MEAQSPDNADEMWMLCWPLLSFSLECKGLSSYLVPHKFVNCNLLYRFYNAEEYDRVYNVVRRSTLASR
jgi:hypothetical protein